MNDSDPNHSLPTEESPPAGPEWRIDELARRAQTSVDTIRYYQRERLLSPGIRRGRVNLYGTDHLERLQQIQGLQERRFSLAAIRALLNENRVGLIEGIFADDAGRTYSLEELIEEANIPSALAASLRTVGFLRDPAEFGKDSYDGDDLEVLRTLAALRQIGLPAAAIVEIGRLYAEGIETTQQSVVDLFATGGELEWDQDDLSTFQNLAAEKSPEILPLAQRLVDYTHHRTIQRLTLGALTDGALTDDEGY